MFLFHPDLHSAEIASVSHRLWSLRPGVGDIYTATNLNGDTARATIKEIDRKKKKIFLRFSNHKTHTIPQHDHTIIQALPNKTYLSKWAETLPFLPIDNVFLFRSQYSPQYTFPSERIDHILTRSCELAQITHKPSITLLQTNTAVADLFKHKQPFILDQDASTLMQKSNQHVACVAIGPEGGWGVQDRVLFETNRCSYLSLQRPVLPSWFAMSQVWL